MDELYIKDLNLNPKHRFELKKTDFRGARKGWDSDYYTYDEFDENNEFVRTLTIEDATKTYPPFNRVISFA